MRKPTGAAGSLQIVMHTTLFFHVFLVLMVNATSFRRIAKDQVTRATLVEVDSDAIGSVNAGRLAGFDGLRRNIILAAVHVTIRDGEPRVRTVSDAL
jgi:hypothetical protein